MSGENGWGSKWGISKELEKSIDDDKGIVNSQLEKTTYIYTTDEKPWPITGHVLCDVDKDGNIDLTPLRDKLKSQGSNLVDDQAYLYFQCESCNEILDPHTKSFKTLQDKRVEAGWKCVWNIDGMGYKVYCAKCGEKVK